MARRIGKQLPRSFFARSALDVAPELLGKVLVHDGPEDVRVSARLVEVEAYLGTDDPGSHAYRGPTPRNEVMFGAAGHLYVYLSYGIHFCMNVVCGELGTATAVLLRAGAPVDGIEVMRARRPAVRRDRDLCAGPGRLTQAFGLDRAANGIDLIGGDLRIVDDGVPPPDAPGVSDRIGLGAGKGDDRPWRWYVPGDPNVSPARPPRH